jgi:hypothetical protein
MLVQAFLRGYGVVLVRLKAERFTITALHRWEKGC